MLTPPGGATTPDGIALKVYNYLSTHDPPGPISLAAEPTNYWGLMVPGAPTECSGLANLMRLACGVVGVPASVGYIYATTDCNCFSTSVATWETRLIGGQTEQLWFEADGLNKWEAVCVISTGLAQPFNNHYYGPRVTHNTSSVQLLKTIVGSNQLTGNYQCWAHFVGTPETGEWKCNHAAPEPVPLPEDCP